MQKENPLNKKQINLLVLIGIAILFPLVGGSIRAYYDASLYIELSITVLLTIILFICIRKSVKIVITR